MNNINKKNIEWLKETFIKKKYLILILIFLQSLQAVILISIALILRSLIDYATKGNKNIFIHYCIILVIIYSIYNLINYLYRYYKAKTKYSIENILKDRLFTCLFNKDYSEVTHTHSGVWMQRLTSDTQIVSQHMTTILPEVVGLLLRLVFSILVLLYLAPKVVLLLIPFGIIMLVGSLLFKKVMKRLHKREQEADERYRVFIQESLESQLIIRSYEKEEENRNRELSVMKDHFLQRMKTINVSNFLNSSLSLIMNLVYASGIIYCGFGLLNQRISYGTFMAVIQLVAQARNPLANMTNYIPNFYTMLASSERLMEAEGLENEIKEYKDHKSILDYYQNTFNSITFNNVSFKYKDSQEDALCNINLTMNKGDLVVLTGHSGCGKSTLLKLLLALYQPTVGKITLNNDQLIDSSWRGLFAYVPQGNLLMSGTIEEIVTFNDTNIDQDQLNKALNIACCDEFISKLELGIHTSLKEKNGLSEGQMQRLAIARAIYSNRPILLLDEATSALDEVTERQVLLNIKALSDRTVILVAHRKTVLPLCDIQINLEKGGK